MNEFERWLQDAQPGDICCYWEGWLAVDRAVLPELDAVGTAAYEAFQSGLVELTQDLKHRGGMGVLPEWVYIARRKGRGGSAQMIVDKAAMMAGSAYSLRNRTQVPA